MIIDFDRMVAYRCASCGEITCGDFSAFELSGKKGISVHCGCGESGIKITSDSGKGYVVSIECLICEKVHRFHLTFDALLKKDCNEFLCPESYVGLGFLGKKKSVEKAISENESAMIDVVRACGLEHTGKNGIVMIKALDKIQDLSESNALKCICGSQVIDVEIREDEIVLECCLCGEKKVIKVSDIKKSGFTKIEKIIIGQN